MLYDIKLKISYTYATPAEASRTLLRILPRNTSQQALVSGQVQSEPAPTFRHDGTDFFGNPTTELAHDQRLDQIEFLFEGRVQRHSAGTTLDLGCSMDALAAELSAHRSIAPDSPHHFLAASPRVPHDPQIAAFAQSIMEPGISALDVILAMNHTIHDMFEFDPDATHVETTPAEAFRHRRGVCQDLSHVTISGLRALGIPAGYVSGFLRTEPPKGQPRLAGADAMHAWVRAWGGHQTGWVEIDPTNNLKVGRDHVTVAIGRDYSDVAPVKGSMRSEGGHATAHSVDMIPVSEDA